MKKKLERLLVLCVTTMLLSQTLSAQTRNVNGKVLSENGDELSSTTITVVNVANGAKNYLTTDSLGLFTLSDLNISQRYNIYFDHVGHESDSLINYAVLARENSNLLIRLKPLRNSLQEVVVVGYGTQRRSDVSGAITSVKPEDMQGIPTRSVAEMLRGRAAGVDITTSSARPGGTSDILIRGRRSLNGGNGPLFIVDNVPVDATTANDINAEDISSVEILKDASSQAIYGARAANGVILITTKRGLANKVAVNYSGYAGVQQLKKNFDLYNATEWAQLRREAYRTDNNGMYLPDADVFDPSMLEMLESGSEIDWQKFMIRDARIQKHDVSVRAGGDKTKVAFSLGYFNQQGMVENSGFERGTARLNFDQDISKRIKIGANITYTRNFQTLEDGNLNEYIIVTPLAKPYDANGDLQLWVDNISTPNPKFLNQQTVDERRSQNLLFNFFGNVNLLPGLNYRLKRKYTHSRKRRVQNQQIPKRQQYWQQGTSIFY